MGRSTDASAAAGWHADARSTKEAAMIQALRQVHAFFRQRSPAQLLATAAPDSSPWLPDRYRHCLREAA
jgi:hypothetical protein